MAPMILSIYCRCKACWRRPTPAEANRPDLRAPFLLLYYVESAGESVAARDLFLGINRVPELYGRKNDLVK